MRPLQVLGDLIQGPARLCGKRNDKLMDFTTAASKLRQNKDSGKRSQYEEELAQTRTTYEALNSQLVAELPRLLELGTKVVSQVVRELITARKLYVGSVTKELLSIMEVIIKTLQPWPRFTISMHYESIFAQMSSILQIYKRRVSIIINNNKNNDDNNNICMNLLLQNVIWQQFQIEYISLD